MNPTESCECIMLVDDELLVRDFASTLLRQSGYSVLCACDAAEPVHNFRGNASIDVLLTDVQMGDGCMNGFELAALVMSEHPGIQVVIMSGLPDNGERGGNKGTRFFGEAIPTGHAHRPRTRSAVEDSGASRIRRDHVEKVSGRMTFAPVPELERQHEGRQGWSPIRRCGGR